MTIPCTLGETALHKRLLELASSDTEVRALSVTVDALFREATEIMRTVVVHMPQYTLHDDIHLVAVVDLMGRLLGREGINRLAPLEVAACILCAAFHDLGMAPPAAAVRELLAAAPGATAPTEEQTKFLRFRAGHRDMWSRREDLAKVGDVAGASAIDGYMLAEFIRTTHGERTERMIRQMFGDRCVYAAHSFGDSLARACRSHVEDASTLSSLPTQELVRVQERCNWQFVALLLRLADVLDFDPKRTPATLFAHLGIHDGVSVEEWMKHRAIRAWDVQPGQIAFSAVCESPVIEDTIRRFIKVIDRELRSSRRLLHEMHVPWAPPEQYSLDLPADVDAEQVRAAIGKDGQPLYEYIPLQFRLDQDAVMEILMGVSLYGEAYLFLRELLQNAVDACLHRAAHEGSRYIPTITVRISDDGTVLEVEDNGMGMNRGILERYFARIGQSYYRSADFSADVGSDRFRPVSRFGIGVLAVFMVGNHLQVDTLSARGRGEDAWFVEVADKGSLFWMRRSARKQPGTLIRLHLTEGVDRVLPIGSGTGRVAAATGAVSTVATPFDRLRDTTRHLVPRPPIPIGIESGAERVTLTESFQSPSMWGVEKGLTVVETIVRFDEASDSGVRGWVRVYVLVDKDGRPVPHLPGNDVAFPNGGPMLVEGARTGDYYAANFGSISRNTLREVEGQVSGYGVQMMQQGGQWSQQGFRVPGWNLFGLGTTTAPLPFPALYDLDISGPYCFALTADRTRVMDVEQSRLAAAQLSERVAYAAFCQLVADGRLVPNASVLNNLIYQGGSNAEPVARALATIRAELGPVI